MKAKEMFKELGYERFNLTEKGYLSYKNNVGIMLVFDLKEKQYYLCEDDDMCVSYTVEEHQAIHQQMKELGWVK